MKLFGRPRMTTLGLVIGAVGMTLAASAPAQASTITNRYRGDCLATQSRTHAEQIRTKTCNSSNYQKWNFTPAAEAPGYYRISNVYNGMCLDVGWANTHNGAQVVQAWCNGGDNQFWRRERTWSGAELLRPRHTEYCLDISWGMAIHYECNGAAWQEFWIS